MRQSHAVEGATLQGDALIVVHRCLSVSQILRTVKSVHNECLGEQIRLEKVGPCDDRRLNEYFYNRLNISPVNTSKRYLRTASRCLGRALTPLGKYDACRELITARGSSPPFVYERCHPCQNVMYGAFQFLCSALCHTSTPLWGGLYSSVLCITLHGVPRKALIFATVHALWAV